MKSLLLLWQRVADESATRCCTSATRDCKTVSGRFKHEGESFFTITLPQFGKDFELSLDRGVVDHSLFKAFAFREGLPRFLGGFLDQVFDRSSGVLLDVPNIDAIRAIRQLTLMLGKMFLQSSDARTKRAMSAYIECEEDISLNEMHLSARDWSDFRRISSMVFVDVFTRMDREIYDGNLYPKHGPGATADKLRGNAKYRQTTWPRRLEESYFSSSEFLIPNFSYYGELEEDVDILEPESEIPVKVISVPKTQKTPRIIGVEPTAMQYAQQAVLPVILRELRRDDFLRSALGFKDQEPNQLMALEGSREGALATLDLSEASDRVSYRHVMEMLRNHPHLQSAVSACRSTKADVPGYGVKSLSKFASMGSALCFPMEAMVFLTLVLLGIEKELSTSLSRRDLFNLLGRVRIYGDDIIIPVEYVHSVIETLEHFGARVNSSKSFWTGKFRESCGKEYYDGEDVTIVRVRQPLPASRKDATEVISLVSFRNQLYWAGYWEVCKWLDEEIRMLIKHFPVVLPSSPVLGRESVLGFDSEACKQHGTLHHPLVKGYVVHTVIPKNSLDDYSALLKFLLERGYEESEQSGETIYPDLKHLFPKLNEDHLERSGRPLVVDIKLRWNTPY